MTHNEYTQARDAILLDAYNGGLAGYAAEGPYGKARLQAAAQQLDALVLEAVGEDKHTVFCRQTDCECPYTGENARRAELRHIITGNENA